MTAAVGEAAAAADVEAAAVDDPRPLGLGAGWRPELALALERYPNLGFVEVLAEDLAPSQPLPGALQNLQERGLQIIPHGVSLSLGSVEPPDPARLDFLSRLARRTNAPLVSEHLAFVRAGGRETGHLLPLPRTETMLEVLVENITRAQEVLPVPLAVENIASLVEWPESEWDEIDFLAQVLERTGAWLLLDVSNLYANGVNHGWDPAAALDRLPLDRIAYAHVGGGTLRGGVYHDTHTHPAPTGVLDLLEEISARTELPGVLLERDDFFPTEAELHAELDALAAAVERGRGRHAG